LTASVQFHDRVLFIGRGSGRGGGPPRDFGPPDFVLGV